jgi:ParB family chromosome partitioning protein
MAQKRQALGRGLSALLADKANVEKDESVRKEILGGIASLPIELIEENPFQPRTHFSAEALEELSSSIAELGIIQPITVRQVGEKFQLISGERRFRASKMAGLKEIPTYVRMANDESMLELALVENIQRQDLDAIEVAISYQRLIEECDLTQEEMSQRVGKKRSTITNYLRLLKLNPIIQAGIRDQMISMGHARALVNIEDETAQLEIYQQTISKSLSVRQVEELVRSLRDGKNKKDKKRKTPLPFEFQRAKEDMNAKLGTKTEIERNSRGSGKIVISFTSDGEFERILQTLHLKD